MSDKFFKKLSHFGVLSREETKNDPVVLQSLLRKYLVQKVFKKGRVFYALTDKALPLLEELRQVLLHQAALRGQLSPRDSFYKALLGDLRFLNEKHFQAEAFRFLGDWHLTRPAVSSQLKLSQMRYYAEHGL
ncbi:MAG TPA: hypothetical protein VFW62_07095 [bacterium]|nr:hypothetical protein [bacterium]